MNTDEPLRVPYGYPKTKDEWWNFCEYYAPQLRNMVATFHPAYARWAPPMRITAPAAEQISEQIREEIESETKEDPLRLFDESLKFRDIRMADLLGQTWFGIPESTDAHSIPAFGVLCDLCSERYVLNGEYEE